MLNKHLIFTIMCMIGLVTVPHIVVNATSYGHKTLLDQFQLRLNQTASEPNGLSIKFLNVTDDSRCPSDVKCVWQGKSTISVNVVKNGQNVGNFVLTSGLGNDNSTAMILDGYVLQIIKIEPYPSSHTKISLSDYVATISLSKLDALPPLKQFKSGTGAQQVECKTNFQLIIKTNNNMPACVLPSTASVLMSRGWGIAPGFVPNS